LGLVDATRRLAIVGLAKNTGKTVALNALLGELHERGTTVGVTSIGRDGEERDVIDIRIAKPRISLPAGSLIASTDSLLRASGLPHQLLGETAIHTPLGRVVICRLLAAGQIQLAGPSSARDAREVSEVMLGNGAERVLIDGAINRRAASSPTVTDGLVLSTGAVLDKDIERVVALTKNAAELARLPEVSDPELLELPHDSGESMLIAHDRPATPLPPRFALQASEEELAELLGPGTGARAVVLAGAVCEPFLESLARVRRGKELEVVAQDSAKVFLTERSSGSYRSLGINITVLAPTRLLAITVNPLAPYSHTLDSSKLRAMIEVEIPDVPVVDVMDPDSRVPLAA
jgi:hypothetical protein